MAESVLISEVFGFIDLECVSRSDAAGSMVPSEPRPICAALSAGTTNQTSVKTTRRRVTVALEVIEIRPTFVHAL